MKITANVKEYLTNFKYAAKIIFAASKKYFILKTVMSVVSSIIPYIPMFLWRELINALSALVSGESDGIVQKIWQFVVLYCVVSLAENLLKTVSDYIVFKYEDEINYYIDNLMVDKVSSADIGFFDSSELKNHLNNSWNLIYSAKQMVTFVFDMLQGFIRLGCSFVLLLTLSLWMIPVAVLLCIPSVIWDDKIEKIDYQFEKKTRRDAPEAGLLQGIVLWRRASGNTPVPAEGLFYIPVR